LCGEITTFTILVFGADVKETADCVKPQSDDQQLCVFFFLQKQKLGLSFSSKKKNLVLSHHAGSVKVRGSTIAATTTTKSKS